MDASEIRQLLEKVGAVRHGHFELSSGRHSAIYVQCALVLQHPELAERLGRALAEKFKDLQIECVVSPALGGILVGHEVGRALGVRAIFVERDSSGQMALRRGFSLRNGERVLVVEDVWTTGGSTRETMGVVEQAGGRAVAAAALIDRSNGQIEWDVPAKALIEISIPSHEAFDCPLCRRGEPVTKPGSHFARLSA
ncbi:MAG: orotate phosphoribosyltransferase [Candidatus Acidiferrales bacterium]